MRFIVCIRRAGVVTLAVLVPALARANFCAMDAVPAATLLFPYVTVDLKADGTPDPEGQTTITRVTNLSREAVIVHFTVWDVAGVARFCFDEILAGYDVVQVNWRDVLEGRGDRFDTSREDIVASLPWTRSPFEWGPDGRGSKGALSAPANRSAITAGQCPGPPPYGDLSNLGPTLRNLLAGSITSRKHAGCYKPGDLRYGKSRFGEQLGPSPLFFYVTADVVSACTGLMPSDPGYWTTVTRTNNVLVGDMILFNARVNASEMMTAVHIEAKSPGDGRSAAGFYGEKVGVATNREPLPTAFALNYADDVLSGITSNLIFWKNFTELDAVDDPAKSVWGRPVDCGSYAYYAWDMDERSLAACTQPISECSRGFDPNQFPFATQKVPVTTSYFDLPDTSGWILIVLPPSYDPGFADRTPDGKGYLQRPYMGWAGVQSNYGRYSAGSQAALVANAHCSPDETLPRLAANPGTAPKPSFCAQDQVPAATLLFPYVTVDLKDDGTPDAGGQTTITRIINVAPEAAIVHFTAWDAAGVPRIDFDEVLSGYDVLQINWRDFMKGRFDMFDTSRTDFTRSSPWTFDPFEWGPDSQCVDFGCRAGLSKPQNRNAITTAQCATVPPYGNRDDLATTICSLMGGVLVAREHAGCASPAQLRVDKNLFGADLTASPIFFYVTVDVVSACNLSFPSDAIYWTTYATTRNVLIGDVIYLDARANTSEMVPAVHIEAASGAGGGPSVTGFYEERGVGETNREPLATAFMIDYGSDPAAGISSNLIFWKNFSELDPADDPKKGVFGRVVDCGSYVYYAFDMDGRSLSPQLGCIDCPVPGPDPNQLPFVTQKVPLRNSYFDLPGQYGFMLIVLPPSYGNGFGDPTPDGRGYQQRPYMGWAGVQFDYGGYSAGEEGITLANALCFPNQVLPGLGVKPRPPQVRRHIPER